MISLEMEPNLLPTEFGLWKKPKSLIFSKPSDRVKQNAGGCTKCPLRNANSPEYRKSANPACKYPDDLVMFIVDRPASPVDECTMNSTRILRNAINNAGIKNEFVTVLTRCTAIKPPTKNAVVGCEEYLRKQIEICQPKVIVALGRQVAGVFNVSGSLDSLRNQVYDITGFEFGNPKLIVTYDLDKVASDYSYARSFKSDVNKAHRIATTGGEVTYDYQMFESAEEFGEWVDVALKNFNGKIVMSTDIETTGLDPWAEDAKLRTIAFSWAERKAKCVPYEQDPEGYKPHLKRLLESDIRFTLHNATFDMGYLKVVTGINIKHIAGDTMVMCYLLDPLRGRIGLKGLAQEYTELGAYDTEVKAGGFATVDILTLSKYNCADVDCTKRLYTMFEKEITTLGMGAIHRVLSDFNHVLVDMFISGTLIDVEYVEQAKAELGELIEGYTKELKELAGGEYLWNSPADIGNILSNVLDIKVPKSDSFADAKSDSVDTDDNALDIAQLVCLENGNDTGYKFIEVLRKYRKAFKLSETYFSGYFSKIGHDNRLRARYHLTRTKTGRLSSSDPNWQNLPRKMGKGDVGYDELNKFSVKDAIKAPEGWTIISADQSQVEMRVAAMVSNDVDLKQSYINEIDIHSLNAKVAFALNKDVSAAREKLISDGLKEGSEEFAIALLKAELAIIKAENDEERNRAKSVSFGTLYGMGPWGLKFNLDNKTRRAGKVWDIDECKVLIERFFDKFKGLADWQARTKRQSRRDKYVSTVFGRRRPLPGYDSPDNREKSKSARESINTPIQSAASDIMICGIVNIRNSIDPERAKIIATVHDSVVLEVRDDYVDEVIPIIKRCLENPTIDGHALPFINVPLVAEFETGKCYGQLKGYKLK